MDLMDAPDRKMEEWADLKGRAEESRRVYRWVGLPVLACYFLMGIATEFPGVMLSILVVTGYNITNLTGFYTLLYVPWCLRVLFGALFDALPIRGMHRKPYLAISISLSILLYASFFLPSTPSWGFGWLLGAALLASVCQCTTDLCLDGVSVARGNALRIQIEATEGELELVTRSEDWAKVVERAENLPAEVIAATVLVKSAASLVGMGLAVLASAFLFKDPTKFLAWNAVFPLLALVAAYFVEEPTHLRLATKEPSESSKIKAEGGWWVVTKRVAQMGLGPFLFMILSAIAPTSGSLFFQWMYSRMMFGYTKYHLVSLVVFIPAIGAASFYKRFLVHRPLRLVFAVGMAGSAAGALWQAYFVHHYDSQPAGDHGGQWATLAHISGFQSVITFFSRITLMPVLAIAARSCPPRAEASVFSLFLSIRSGATLLGGGISTAMAQWVVGSNPLAPDYSRLPLLIIICLLCSVPTFLLLFFLSPRRADQVADGISDGNKEPLGECLLEEGGMDSFDGLSPRAPDL